MLIGKEAVFAIGLLLGACNAEPSWQPPAAAGQPDQGKVTDGMSNGGQPSAGAAGGGTTDLRPRALLTSPVRASSAIDSSVRLSFTISCPPGGLCTSDQRATPALVAAHVRFIGRDGEAVGVTPVADVAAAEPSPGKPDEPEIVPLSQYSIEVAPSRPLQTDAFYEIEVTSDHEAVIGFLGATEAE